MPPPPAELRLHARFYSRGLRNHRDLVIWLPPGYGRTRRRYPVVYFQDGQNIFDPATAFLGHAWQAGDRAAELIRRRRLEAAIMVGVYNTGFDRMNEYAPTPAAFAGWNGEASQSTGDARRYARFFVNEVKPFIDANYLTRPAARHNSVVGSSMGGLVSLYFALWYPQVFGQVAALSPSVWWDDRTVIRAFARLRRKPAVRLWLDMGTAEPGWEVIRQLRDSLVARGWKAGRDLHYHEVPDAAHTEAAWGARIGEVLRWLLPRESLRRRRS